MAELAALQRLFYERVTGQVGSDAPAGDLTATGNLAIYASMYAIRLGDALADDYPKLRSALGAEAFAEVVEGYLRAHPPRSFTLRDTGLLLAAWLRTVDVAPAWAADLAALERARIEVFDGPDAPALGQAEAIALGDALPNLLLRWVPSSVVVPIAWAVDDLWSAIEDDQPAFAPSPARRVVLVWRRELSVLHRTLDPDEATVIAPFAAATDRPGEAPGPAGARFADVCERLAEVHADDAGTRAAELLLRWLAAGALAATIDELPAPPNSR